MYYNEWVEFLNEHESMSLLMEEPNNMFSPINDQHFVIYANALVKYIEVTDDDIVIHGFKSKELGSVKHMEPYNNVIFSKAID